jgi:hypothetical protein
LPGFVYVLTGIGKSVFFVWLKKRVAFLFATRQTMTKLAIKLA